MINPPHPGDVLCMRDLEPPGVRKLLCRFGITLKWLEDTAAIKGSFWGAPEAGIVRSSVHVRADTPVHSFLHETCHIICMAPDIRDQLAGDAASDDLEEAAVCYLQILLADLLPTVGRDRLMSDMDAWGYSFRLGSARHWFEFDAEDARNWLLQHQLIDESDCPGGNLRQR
jgi:hypothetical protein